MPLFVPVYQFLRLDQLCHTLLPRPPSYSRLPLMFPLSHSANLAAHDSSRSLQCVLAILPLAIHPPARPVAHASRTDIIASLALSGYTQTWPQAPPTYASIHAYLLPPSSSFPCADHAHPSRIRSLYHRCIPSPSLVQPLDGCTPVYHPNELSLDPLLNFPTRQRRASAYSVVELLWM
jgi:hypothetical protein